MLFLIVTVPETVGRAALAVAGVLLSVGRVIVPAGGALPAVKPKKASKLAATVPCPTSQSLLAARSSTSPAPLAVVPRLRGRLLIAHGVADDSIPFTESLRLAQGAGGRAELMLLDTFHHTGAQPFWWSWRARVADGWNLARLADALVRIDRHRR